MMFNLNCNHSIVKYIKFLKTTYKDLKNINNYYMGSNYPHKNSISNIRMGGSVVEHSS